jgi:hypothetical protein
MKLVWVFRESGLYRLVVGPSCAKMGLLREFFVLAHGIRMVDFFYQFRLREWFKNWASAWDKSMLRAFRVGFSVLGNSAFEKWREMAGRLPWCNKALEVVIPVAIALMPVFGSWIGLLPLLIVWLLTEDQDAPIQGGLFVLGIIAAVSAFFSATGSNQGWDELMQFQSWLLMAWLVAKTFNPERIRRVRTALIIGGICWMLIGYLQYWSGIPTPPGWVGPEQAEVIPIRAYSVFGNPNLYALFLLSLLIWIGEFWLDESRFSHRLGLGLLLGLVLLSLSHTYSRTAWVLAALYLVIRFHGMLRGRRLAILLVLLLGIGTQAGLWERILSLWSWRDSTLGYRWEIWRGVARILGDHWIWGIGPGNFEMVYPWYQKPGIVADHAHQLYLQFWLEYGVFSLIALLLVFWNIGSKNACHKEHFRAAWFNVLAFLGYGLTESWMSSSMMGGYFWFLIGLALATRQERTV